MNQFPCLYERYVPLTEEKPILTLAETRDRAVSDARTAEETLAIVRHENIQLRQILRKALEGPWTDDDLERARALLTKVSR